MSLRRRLMGMGMGILRVILRVILKVMGRFDSYITISVVSR